MTPSRASAPGPMLLTLALSAAVAGLAWVNIQLGGVTIDTSPASASATSAGGSGEPQRPDLSTRLDRRGIATFAETTARPVFSPSRRPDAERPQAPQTTDAVPPPAEAAEDASLRGFRLLGTVQDGRNPRRALIRPGEQDAPRWVAEGQEIGGWRLIRIGAAGVTIEARGTKVELKLYAR